MIELSAEEKEALAGAWLERTAAAYPPQTARFLLGDRDPFRNPVGHAFRRALPVLVEELAGEMDRGRIAPALGEIMHIRAVQYLTAEEAIGFVFLLEDLAPAALRERIELLAEMARGEFRRCQERIEEIRAREVRRRTFVRERMESG